MELKKKDCWKWWHKFSNSGEALDLLDLNINQNQKALRAVAYQSGFKYGMFTMVIIPNENPTLDEAKKLAFRTNRSVKKGAFQIG